MRWRSTLKLMTDLFRIGVFSDCKPVLDTLKLMTNADNGSDPSLTLLSILTGFVRYAGFDFLGISTSRQQRDQHLAKEVSFFVSRAQKLCVSAFVAHIRRS